MSTALFIAMCVLAIINILLYTFVASAIHKRDLCQKSPYYHCETDWICCKPSSNPNPSTPPPFCDVAGVQIGTNAYYITDQIYGTGSTSGKTNDTRGLNLLTCNGKQGTYYELCVLPVQTVYKGYTGTTAPNLVCLYAKDVAEAGPEVSPEVFTDCTNHMNSYSNIFSFTAGQCCYQKFDPSATTPNIASPNTLYPYIPSGSTTPNTAWNNTGLYGGGNYTSPTDYTFPQGSNTNTLNNSCYNSFYSHNDTNPNQFYAGCAVPPK
jgi:hypothetical protein